MGGLLVETVEFAPEMSGLLTGTGELPPKRAGCSRERASCPRNERVARGNGRVVPLNERVARRNGRVRPRNERVAGRNGRVLTNRASQALYSINQLQLLYVLVRTLGPSLSVLVFERRTCTTAFFMSAVIKSNRPAQLGPYSSGVG